MKVFFQIKKRLRIKIITNKAVKIITKLKMKLNLAKPLPLYFSGFSFILDKLIEPNIRPSKNVNPVKNPKTVETKLKILNGSIFFS